MSTTKARGMSSKREHKERTPIKCPFGKSKAPSPTSVTDDGELQLSNSGLSVPISPLLFFFPKTWENVSPCFTNSSQLWSQFVSIFRFGSKQQPQLLFSSNQSGGRGITVPCYIHGKPAIPEQTGESPLPCIFASFIAQS